MSLIYPLDQRLPYIHYRAIYAPLLIWRCARLTFSAHQHMSQHGGPASLRDNPGPLNPGRVVTHVLKVAAAQLRPPMALRILMKAGNRTFYAGCHGDDLIMPRGRHSAEQG